MFKSLTFRGFYSAFSRALFAAMFFMFCGIFVAGAYTVTYNCGSVLPGQSWTGSSDNPTPTQSAINCTTGGLLVGYCCQNGDYIYEVRPNQLIPNLSDDVTCQALWAQQRQLSFQYNIGNCSISDPTNLYGTSSSYSVPIQRVYTEHCMGVTEDVFPNQLAILSPYNSGLNWSPQSSSNIFTSTEDLSNCVNFDYWKDFANNATYNCSTGSNGTCGTINVSGGETLFAHCNWTEYPVVYHDCDGNPHQSSNSVVYGAAWQMPSYNSATGLTVPLGYSFKGWTYSGTTYSDGDNFTWDDCAVSGTTIDLYANCECDNANNWWWNADNTACVQGYTIQLKILPEYATPEPTYPTAPTTLYTIPTRGAYLDAARTLLMTKTSNPIQLPYLEFMLNFDTNTPVNPVNNTQYSVPNVDSINMAGWYHCFSHPNMTGGIYAGHGWSSSTCFIHNTPNNYTDTSIRNLTPTNRDGYLTDQGIYEAENQYQNQTWYINGKGWNTSYYADNPTLTGYTFVNWCTDPENTTSCFKGQVPNNVQNHIYYAHWTPNTYDVVYNPGAHAASGSTAYTDTDGATYDSPYTPLSFGASPISNNMSAGTGYVFVGWTTDSTPTFTNGNLDNEYTGDTYWKRTSTLTLYAAYECDFANSYQWNANHTACESASYTITYSCGTASGSSWGGGSYPENELISVLPNASNCTPPTGQDFTGYVCTYGSSTLTLNQCSLSGLDASINGGMLQYGYINADGTSNNASTYNLTQNETWADGFSYGTIRGKSKCSSTGGTYMQFGTPLDVSGKYCWCKATSLDGQTMCALDNVGGWILNRTDFSDVAQCESSCAASCADYLNNRADYRSAVFNVSGSVYNFTMPAADVICTAQWDCDTANGYQWNTNHTACENLHSLQYVVTPAGVPVQVPASLMIPSGTHYHLEPKPEAPGYVCSDWSCTETINNGYIDMPAADVTCTSTCDCDTANGYHHSGDYCDNTYRVLYYKGNCPLGNGSDDDGMIYTDTAWWGNPYTVLSPYNSTFPQILADGLSNYSNCVSFNGWNKSGSSTVYNNCGTGTGGDCGSFNFLDTEDVNLYAVCNWTPYSVIYHGCDGTSTYTSPNTVIYGGSFNVLSYADTNLSSTGYTFQNWNTAADGSGTDYAPNASFTMNDCAVSGTTIDLYAQCNKNTYTLTYVANAPSGTTVTGMPNPNPITLAYGTNHILATGVSASGYTNQGWECEDENNNIIEQHFDWTHDRYIIMPSSNVICTAQWDTNIVYLKWYKTDTDTQQYTDGNPTTSCQYGVGTISPLPTQPTRTGYSFAGWKVTGWECDLSVIDATINGNSYNSSYGTVEGTWSADFSYGRLSGESKCIEQNAAPTGTCATTGTKAQIDAACYWCYCKLTNYTSTGGSQCNVSTTSWQLYGYFTGSCSDSCANFCAMSVKMNYGTLRERVLIQSH